MADETANNQTDDFAFTPEALFGETEPEQSPVHVKSKEVYFQTIDLFGEICDKMKSEDEVDCNALKMQIDAISELLRQDERMIMGLANAPYAFVLRHISKTVSSPIVIHGVNVMIYALKISLDLSVPVNRLPYIGVASLCYRISLLDAPEESLKDLSDNASSQRVIKEFEGQQRKYTRKIKIDNFHTESIDFLITLVKEDQQVLSKTSLYEAMYQYAMVIHICDEFERLTHQKTYGEVYAPVDAMKKLRGEMKDFFNQDIIKLFFNKLSIYPLGSFVKLSSRETAKIIGINENFIMRPEVMVVLDNEGREKLEPIRINLRQKPNLYIKKAVVDDFLTENFIDLF